MKRKVVRTLFAAATALAVVGVSACSGSDDESGSGDGEQAASPIAEFLGQPDFTDPQAAETQFIEDERARQQIMADCMAEQGFEYVPMDPDQMMISGDSELEWGSDEWVEKYGFGITTMRFSQEEVGPGLVGFDAPSGGQEFEDPNQEMLEAMTDQERDAYYAALYGEESFAPIDETMSEEELAEEELVFEPGGCQGEAYDQEGSNRFYIEFQDELDELYQRIESDPRIVEAEQEVSDCVAERGLTYTDEQSVFEEFNTELQQIDQMAPFPGQNLTEEEVSSMSEEELNELFGQGREFPQEALDLLAELQTREIDLAVAVNGCGGGFQNRQDLYQEVSAEHEQEFLEEHADELAEFEGSVSSDSGADSGA